MPSSADRPAMMRVLEKVGLEPASPCACCQHGVEDHVIWDEDSLHQVSLGRCFRCPCTHFAATPEPAAG